MANTFVKIASVTVGSGGAATMDFTSIPATYTDLLVKVSSRFDANQNNVFVSYNGSSSSFSFRSLYGNGSIAGSTNGATNAAFLSENASYTASIFASADFYIPNYAGNNYKSASSDSVQENNTTTAFAFLYSSLWSNTAAITSITLTPDTGANFVQYSTATLYGIKSS
jgi:hypothetical protein